MPNDFLKLIETRLNAAKERSARAYREHQLSRAEVAHLEGLIGVEQDKAKLAGPALDDDGPDTTTISGAGRIRDFLLKALPVDLPGKELAQLVAEAEHAELPIEAGKSVARTLNANLLSLQTLKLVQRGAVGGWMRNKETPPSGGALS